MTREELIERAGRARANAHAPYSRYEVGAAVLASDGSVFTGANVENASFGATVCAERVAVLSAVAAGRRAFAAIAIVTPGAEPAQPCGLCLQVLAEFCDDLDVWCAAADSGAVRATTLRALMPSRFVLEKGDG
jgi:cytidine deaminase